MKADMSQKNEPRQLIRDWSNSVLSRFRSVLERPGFFYVIVGLLVFQAAWIALTARFPQAFDEDFHVGLIQLHAGQWLPFFTQQPAGAEVHGAVVRDPSYLYHYLFSFPYRLLGHLTHSFTVQIISLRFLNIALFALGLFVYRALFTRIGVSRRIMHTVLLLFVLTPIMPLLAANINYDNMIFPLTAALFLYVIRFIQTERQSRQIDIAAWLLVVVYGLVAALVKYTSLPLTAAALVVLGYVVWRDKIQGKSGRLQFVWPHKTFLIPICLLIVLLAGLGVERYGVNIVRYHSLSPDCAKVISEKLCHSYAVWERDYQWAQIYPHPSEKGIIAYPFVWLHRMVFETMFTISSRFGSTGLVEYVPAPPLTVVNYTAWVMVFGGLLSVVAFWKKIWDRQELRYLLIIAAFYGFTLFAKNFSQYLHTGEAIAIHGRYLVPIYPLLYAAGVLGFAYLIERIRRPQLKIVLLAVTLVCLTQGAGLITWIFRSDPSWYWSRGDHDLVYRINRPVQTVVHHIIIP